MITPEKKEFDNDNGRWLVTFIFILIGLVLILLHIVIPPQEGIFEIGREAMKELGIVILSVFAVSFLYEVILAKKYLNYFLSQLRIHVAEGESNSAVCANLGINQIYTSRSIFESQLPLEIYFDQFNSHTHFRATGRSLFQLMTKAYNLQNAINRGATIQLCVYDPSATSNEIHLSPDVEVEDIQATVATFRKKLSDWVKTNHPKGKVALRYHRIPLLDSCVLIQSTTKNVCIWDWSFGRDMASKRILIVDPQKSLGIDLKNRYDYVWDKAAIMFEYDGASVLVDNLNVPTSKDA